jgi:mRNA interferase MazF
VNRYDIHFAPLDPVRGAEMGKTRPAVIVSDDLSNRSLQTVVVCPLTTVLHPAWRTRLQIHCAGRLAEIAVDQIRVLSKSRIRTRIGSLPAADAAALRQLLVQMYGEE